MKTITLLIGIALLLVACATTAPPVEPPPSTDAQIVNVGVQGATYVFDVESVEAGKPVRLVFDPAQLPGCSRAVAVPGYDLYKVITDEDNTMEFTPMASGPVRVSCSMAMYNGDLMVN